MSKTVDFFAEKFPLINGNMENCLALELAERAEKRRKNTIFQKSEKKVNGKKLTSSYRKKLNSSKKGFACLFWQSCFDPDSTGPSVTEGHFCLIAARPKEKPQLRYAKACHFCKLSTAFVRHGKLSRMASFLDRHNTQLGINITNKNLDICLHQLCLDSAHGPTMLQDFNSNEDTLDGYIIKNIRALKGSKCRFCKKSGAKAACAWKRCKTFYHLPCGIRNGTYQQKRETTFRSYCPKHAPKAVEDDKRKEMELKRQVPPLIIRKLNLNMSIKDARSKRKPSGVIKLGSSQDLFNTSFQLSSQSSIFSNAGESSGSENIEVIWTESIGLIEPIIFGTSKAKSDEVFSEEDDDDETITDEKIQPLIKISPPKASANVDQEEDLDLIPDFSSDLDETEEKVELLDENNDKNEASEKNDENKGHSNDYDEEDQPLAKKRKMNDREEYEEKLKLEFPMLDDKDLSWISKALSGKLKDHSTPQANQEFQEHLVQKLLEAGLKDEKQNQTLAKILCESPGDIFAKLGLTKTKIATIVHADLETELIKEDPDPPIVTIGDDDTLEDDLETSFKNYRIKVAKLKIDNKTLRERETRLQNTIKEQRMQMTKLRFEAGKEMDDLKKEKDELKMKLSHLEAENCEQKEKLKKLHLLTQSMLDITKNA